MKLVESEHRYYFSRADSGIIANNVSTLTLVDPSFSFHAEYILLIYFIHRVYRKFSLARSLGNIERTARSRAAAKEGKTILSKLIRV